MMIHDDDDDAGNGAGVGGDGGGGAFGMWDAPGARYNPYPE